MNTINPYLKAENCTDAADCRCGIEMCKNIINHLQTQGKSATAYQRRLYRLTEKLKKYEGKVSEPIKSPVVAQVNKLFTK